MSKLVLDRVSKRFFSGDHISELLHEASWVFERGKTYAVRGISGVGKSTLLYLLAGFEEPSAGAVLYNDRDLARMTQDERERFLTYTIGFLFQIPALMPELTVQENVFIKGLIAGLSVAECKKKSQELLERIGLGARLHVYPATLSGGEAQRVALLRALFLEPEFLLADEPTAHVDEQHRALVIDLILEYQTRLGMGLLVSTHDPIVAQRMATVLTLAQGRLHS